MTDTQFDDDGWYIPRPLHVVADDLPQFLPVNWTELWADETEDQWLLEPLIPQGGQVVIYSAPKVGKSLLALDVAAGLASGRGALGVVPGRRMNVVYVDHENRLRADVRSRLQAMGYKPGDLDGLWFYSMPRMEKLDTITGGLQLRDITRRHRADLVVLDTVSRTIQGEENSNDTWLQFYLNTGQLLKADKVALLRLDHTGKDEERGQRGGSAKSGDVDMVWHYTAVTDDVFTLKCDASRVELHEPLLTIKRHTEPLTHTVDAMGVYGALEAKQAALLALLDETKAPKDIGAVEAITWLRERGHKCSNGAITKRMLEARKARIS